MHYFGLEAVDNTAKYLKIQPGNKIIDVGSGLGGPARYLSQVKSI